jgi:hypothetical protein
MGLIYKIVIGDNCYVGSTKNLIRRQGEHNSNLRSENYNYLLYEKCREHKIENIILELVEDEVEEEDLKIREQFYIDKLKSTLNTYRAIRTIEDTKQIKREEGIRYRANNTEKLKIQKKEWQENNKEKLTNYLKEYYENNKETLTNYLKDYYENNKDKIKEKNKERYENNKEKLKEKVKCDLCNKEIRKDNLKRHKLSASCKKMWDYMLDTESD